ncbi:MAG: response regulator transcription factor [Bacteroidetes bacterium]|nr:response regulator transcription factor [Bacteroidota bacterium]
MPGITLSIVEDLSEVRESLENLVRDSDEFLFISSYHNAETARERIPEEQPQIVIMDINLPGMSGVECIRKIRDACPHTQFIMYTIFEDDDKVFDALEAGAHGYLLKKTPKEKILEALIEMHNGGAPMSTDIARKVIKSFQRHHKFDSKKNLLTQKETEVLQLLAKGFLYKEIGEKLHISINTVKQHIHNLYEKLHVSNRTEAINKLYGKK